MRHSIVLGALVALGGACSKDGSTAAVTAPTPVALPALVNANASVPVIVGSAVTYDATKSGAAFSDPVGGGLTYSISLSPSNGLSATRGVITGTPTGCAVTIATITATDALGRTVTDRFGIVAFENGLATPVLPAGLLQYADAELPLPAHFRISENGTTVVGTDNTPAANPITDAGATLGRVLFYDPRLSANDGTACASCHIQSFGFADTMRLSVGFAGGLTSRHSAGLTNGRFYQRGRFFWDERAATLEAQVLAPIQNATEMGMTLDALVLKLTTTSYYAPLFAAAFGTPAVTSDRVSLALAQYVRSLVSAGSRYDRGYTAAGATNFPVSLTAQEQQGEQLFRTAGCASCHSTVAQLSDSVHNIGLDAIDLDVGTGGGAIKAPSLRNVGVRQRYMHDGRFTSLAQVVDFFDSGVQANANLDARLTAANGAPKRLGLSAAQKSALVAFLNSLTDSTFLTAARFSNPFVLTQTTPPTFPPTTPTTVVSVPVTIQNIAYHPNVLTVAPGTTIAFTNLDNTRHSATFNATEIGSTPIFTSGTRTLVMPTTPGTYPFHCQIHGLAMSGTVIVK